MINTDTVMINSNHPIQKEIATQDFSLVQAHAFQLSQSMQKAYRDLLTVYPELPPDKFLPDGGAYRFRRYDSFAFTPHTGNLRQLPHQSYFQERDINAVTGGVVREFAPLGVEIAENAFLQNLIRFDYEQFPTDPADDARTWQVDVHLIRVTAKPGEVGHPTPERIHRDGAQYVTVHLMELENATGGEVTVYDDDRQPLASFTLASPLDSYLFRDEVLWHGVTPIAPQGRGQAVRSILTFDYHRAP